MDLAWIMDKKGSEARYLYQNAVSYPTLPYVNQAGAPCNSIYTITIRLTNMDVTHLGLTTFFW